MMKTILIPTDFSSCADNALSYAAEFNKWYKGAILIFHSYLIPVPVTDLPLVPSDAELKNTAMNAVVKLKSEFMSAYPDMKFDVDVNEGYVTDEIVEEEKKAKCDLVIMGTRGANGISELLIGSNTTSVVGKSICPVMVVPEYAKMKGLNKIVFAANYGVDDFKNVFDIIDIA